MKHTKKILAIVLAAIFAAGMLAACGGGNGGQKKPKGSGQDAAAATGDVKFDQDVQFTFATGGQAGSLSAKMYEEFIDRIQKESGGKITVDYQPGGTLGNEQELFQQVMDGVIEAGVGGIATYTNYNKLGEVYQLPFLITSYELEWKALNTPEWKAIMDKTEETIGSVYICGTLDVGMRHIATIDKQVKNINDIKGMKIRTASSEMLTKALTDIGANPIVVGYMDVVSALQNKQVDGEDVNYMSFAVQHHGEYEKYFTEVGMYPYPSFVCFNKSFIDSLPEGYWAFMQKVMNECEEKYFTETIVNADVEFREGLEAEGITVTEVEDADAWRSAIQPLYDEYTGANADPMVKAFIEAVEELK